MSVGDIPDRYADTVGFMNSHVRKSDDITAGDPDRAAEILVRMSRRTHIPYHLPLGANAAEGSIALDEQLLTEDRRCRGPGGYPGSELRQSLLDSNQ